MEIFQPIRPDELREGLALLMARSDATREQIDSQVDSLLAYARAYGLSLGQILVAREAGGWLAACLCVDSAGRISSVFLPAQLHEGLIEPARELLRASCARARARDVQLLQAMLDVDAHFDQEVVAAAGFEKVARLLYLEKDLAGSIGVRDARADLEWEYYTEPRHAWFSQVLHGTYGDSLDCPALNGRRSIEDVVASHRAAGRFDPGGWVVGVRNGEPVGIGLINEFPERRTSEVVYMGVLPSHRGAGHGEAILRQAVRIARQQRSLTLSLSVDETNAPARRLYERFGFLEAARRDAWIRFLS